MNIVKINMADLDQLKLSGIIFILGYPGAGKSHLCDLLAKRFADSHAIIRTDDYLSLPFEARLSAILSDIVNLRGKDFIIEGILVYRLLRHMSKEGYELPGYTVIEVLRDISKIEALYNDVDRPADKLKGVKTMIKANETALNDYLHSDVSRLETWIEINNN